MLERYQECKNCPGAFRCYWLDGCPLCGELIGSGPWTEEDNKSSEVEDDSKD